MTQITNQLEDMHAAARFSFADDPVAEKDNALVHVSDNGPERVNDFETPVVTRLESNRV